jgi:anthranilate synthase component 1
VSVVTRELAGRRDLLGLAAADPRRYPCLLDSAAQGAAARWDILFATSGEALLDPPHAGGTRGERFLDQLDAAWRGLRVARSGGDLPFRGGFLVYLGYELAAECEPRLSLPAPAEPVPTALALRCPAAILYEHARRRTLLVAEAGAAKWLDVLAADLAVAPPAPAAARVALAVREDDPAEFLEATRRVHDYLAAGDTFQVNLSRGWVAEAPAGLDPAALYAALRSTNPAPFAGLFRHGDLAVLSSSPERLVEVRGTRVQTRPIAGTRPRGVGVEDARHARELLGHPKERAEHVMLIDLERNDLGRVCEPGSVEVDELMKLESYTHVHHIVSNVRGRLRADATPGRVLRAVFPGGTITGCPKVRCMQIIAELERRGRGPYTGALGYLNRDGDMDFNILIRTLWLAGGRIRLRAGSGIVADSIAERELDETRSKARGVLRALGVER